MWRKWLRWLSEPVDNGDSDRNEAVDIAARARLINGFLLIALGAVLLYALGTVIAGDGMGVAVWIGLGAFSVLAMLALVFLRQGAVRPVGLSVVFLMWALSTYMVVQFGGIHDEIVPGYFLTIIFAGLILGAKGVVGFSLLSAAALALAYYLEDIGRLDPSDLIPSQMRDLFVILALLGVMAFLAVYVVKRLQALSVLARQRADALVDAEQALVAHRDAADAARARLLRRTDAALSVAQTTTVHIKGTADAGAASLLEPEVAGVPASEMVRQQLLRQVVSDIADQFGFVYVAAFWADPTVGVVTRQAFKGTVDITGVDDFTAHRLRLGEGLVGAVAADGRARLAPELADDPDVSGEAGADLRTRGDDRLGGPGLGRALALPILKPGAVVEAGTQQRTPGPVKATGPQAAASQPEVLGVLVVCSQAAEDLTAEDRSMLQALLAQLSVAIDQAQAFVDVQADLQAAERAYRELRQADWQQLLHAEQGLGYVSTVQATSLVDASHLDVILKDTESGASTGAQSVVRVPIELAGQEIAEVQAHLPADMGAWTEDRIAMLETLSEQLSQAMERARLHRETQRRAVRERVLREITDEMGRASDLSSLMHITMASLNRSLGGSHLYVRLVSDDDSQTATAAAAPGADSAGSAIPQADDPHRKKDDGNGR